MTEYTAAQVSLQDTGSDSKNASTAPQLDNATTAAAKDITFGSLAGVVGKAVEYPFDTVKVRLQSQPDTRPLRYAGPLDCFRQSLREGGIASFYLGISAPMVGAAVEISSLFFSYRLAQSLLSPLIEQPSPGAKLPLSALCACGAASGAFTSALLTPIELVKCQVQVPSQGSTRLLNPLAVIASIYRHNGIVGFWRGQLGTLIRETGGSAAWFGSYEGVCAAFRRYDGRAVDVVVKQPVWQQLLAGASAGMAYNFICYPADTIKSRMQTEELGGNGVARKSFGRVGTELWRQQGLKGMYRGCGITVARAAPSSAFIFVVYEMLLSWAS